MKKGTIVTDLHRVWLNEHRASIESGTSVALIGVKNAVTFAE